MTKAHPLKPAAGARSGTTAAPLRTAYVEGLRMLARRELSEAQIRQRLGRKGHQADAVDAAVERLLAERAINDQRVAEAIAHTEITIRRRGKLRIRRQIEQAGIAPPTARHALDVVFADTDEDALLEASLDKRLRGREEALDDAAFRRLYRYLVSQGFESDRIVAALRRRRRSPAEDPEL
jgi:regulatory protein